MLKFCFCLLSLTFTLNHSLAFFDSKNVKKVKDFLDLPTELKPLSKIKINLVRNEAPRYFISSRGKFKLQSMQVPSFSGNTNEQVADLIAQFLVYSNSSLSEALYFNYKVLQNFDFNFKEKLILQEGSDKHLINLNEHKTKKIMVSYIADYLLKRNLPSDLITLWLQSKFSPPKLSKPKEGDRVLLYYHQRDYQAVDDPRFIERFDPGHAVIGYRRLGGDPEDDFALNPGAKNATGGEVALPRKFDASVKNMQVQSNLYVWAEVQVEQRYMRHQVQYLQLNSSQTKLMDFIIKETKNSPLDFGPAIFETSNCAHGLEFFINTLAPYTKAIDSKLSSIMSIMAYPVIGKPAIPGGIKKELRKKWKVLGELEIRPTKENPNPSGRTPGDGFNTNFPDKKVLESYKNLHEFEKRKIL